VAVVVVAIAVVVLVSRRGGTFSAHSSSEIGSWFAAASGNKCTAGGPARTLPGAIDTVRCQEPGGIQAAFARLDPPAAATRYATNLAHAHKGSTLTAWRGTGADRGDVLFIKGSGKTTLVWTYQGQAYVGSASTSRSTKDLEAWWTNSGRSTR
jgi:hypothetical protein